MTISLTPKQDDVFTVLRSVLTGFLPSGIPIVQGQVNRVPEPQGANFVVMWPMRRKRLATNVDGTVDTRFIGSIAGTTLTITTLDYGAVAVGSLIFGVDVAAGTTVTALGTGTGGVGTYTVSSSQTVASTVMAAGVLNILQPTELTVQLDIHGEEGPNNAQTISTLLRDDYGVQAFLALGSTVVPLHADDPRQMPFVNAEQQYEDRWIVEVCLQVNETVQVPQQFADAVVVGLINVDAAYPPTA